MSQTRSGHNFIRPQIRNQPKMGFPQVDPDLHRLQWNESPFDFPADLKEEVLQRLARISWSRYPLGLRGAYVSEAIAKATGLGSDQVIVSNGSSDILRLVISSVLQAGDHMLTFSPTYRAYTSLARQVGAEVHTIELHPEQNFALPVDTVLEKTAQHGVKLIAICAPNNPTGTVFPYTELRQIAMESDAFILIDAAYAEFSGQDLRPLLTEVNNVVLVHTFSKAFALAGARVGYALSTPEIADELQKLVTTFTLSPFSESVAIVAMHNRDRFQPFIDTIVAERERLAAGMTQLPGVTVYPSGANFLLVHVGHSGKDAQSHLRSQQRVLVTDMGMYAGYEKYLRISVGTPEQNDLVINGLAHYLATVAV